ncbi:MAG: hypothetical protein OXN21_04965 [Chloroflexota bacterium]|nr:hypothetical protein [Chloroflexota bacterium]
MQLCYVHESENHGHYSLAALGVAAAVWPDLSARFGRWRTGLRARYGIPLSREPRARDLLAGGRGPGRFVNPARRLTPEQGTMAFLDGLRVIEDAARDLGGIEVASVCLSRRNAKDHRRTTLNILLEQLHAAATLDQCHRYLLFDEKRRGLATGACDEFAAPDPVPHRHAVTDDGAETIVDCAYPLIGNPYFRKYGEDGLLLAANLVAHVRLLREEEPDPEKLSLGIHRSFDILDHAVGGRARAPRSGKAA